MYPSHLTHLIEDRNLPAGESLAPARSKRRRGSATLPLWRNRPTLLRARVSQR
jgi:hypothetical protein